MPSRPNFADPEFEPTDEQLIALSSEAFAGVRAAREAALQRMREEIAEQRRSNVTARKALANANK